MYKQFALTIAISVLLSAFNALSLTPALCCMLLKKPRPMRGPLGAFFRGFNKVFDVTTSGYVNMSRLLVRRGILTIGIVAVVIVGAGLLASTIPAGFIPDEDQGIFGVNVQLPPGASLERTSVVLKKVEKILSKIEVIDSYPDYRRLRSGHQYVPAELWLHFCAAEAMGGKARGGTESEGNHGAAAA